MARERKRSRTMLGDVDSAALAYTAGGDVKEDLCLVEADCIGTAAHVTMLSEMPLKRRLFSKSQKNRIVAELVRIMRAARQGAFMIMVEDQDVHMAVERVLTERLGPVAKSVHTARSRNDQVAVDLRLYGKEQILLAIDETAVLSLALLKFARKYRLLPMVGRTHMRPAMPGSVGLWASAYAEGLLDDIVLLRAAYEINDQCPLGSAAGYGVPLPIDRQRVSDLLGFARPVHNVMHASNARGKVESIILSAMGQAMITVSRLAQDLILYSAPEFGYFRLPADMCTGSSIMPQKNNPDILELARARASTVLACASSAVDIVKGLPGGYSRDLQETKAPFLSGLRLTRATMGILTPFVNGVVPRGEALRAGFTAGVFATDHALKLVADGVPFREAYLRVKERLGDLADMDADEALRRRTHLGGAAGLDFDSLRKRAAEQRRFAAAALGRYHRAAARLLKTPYPFVP